MTRSEDLLKAYRSTDYRIYAQPPFSVWIDKDSPVLDVLLRLRAASITSPPTPMDAVRKEVKKAKKTDE